MKVIPLQGVRGSGKKGGLVDVSDGYTRNFLLPRKPAKEASAQTMNELKSAEGAKEFRRKAELGTVQKTTRIIEGKSVKLTAATGRSGKLPGSVTVKEVVEAIKK